MIVFSPFRLSETGFWRDIEFWYFSELGFLGTFIMFFRTEKFPKKSACYEFIPPQNLMFLIMIKDDQEKHLYWNFLTNMCSAKI